MRHIDSDNITACNSEQVCPVILCRLDYASGVVNLNSTDYPIIYNSETYHGIGSLASISTVKETVDQQACTLNLQLSGVDTTAVAQAMNENYRGRDARIYAMLFNPDGTPIGSPTILFRGKMDNQTIVLGKQGTITLSVIGRLADLFVPRTRRYNNEDQQSVYPDDKGFEFIAAAVNADLTWGK